MRSPFAGPAFVIAGKDLRERVRDRSALVLGFAAPLVIALLMSLAFSATDDFRMTVAVVDADHGELSAAFRRLVTSDELSSVLDVERVADEATARREVDDGTLDAAFVLPAGFTVAAHGGSPARVVVLADPDRGIEAEVASSIADGFVAQVNANLVSVGTAVASGVPSEQAPRLAAEAAALRLPVQVRTDTVGGRRLSAISYYAPGMGIFFMMFAVGFGSRSLFAEREQGTLDRIAAAPVRPATVLIGKALSTFVYTLGSLLTMWVVTSAFFDAHWGPWPAALALIGAMSLAVVSLTALVMTLARTQRQADGIASILVFGLVLLGGNFVSLAAAPPLLRRLALLTPNGWALRGFTDLATGVAGPTAAVVPVLAILGITAAVALASTVLARRAVLR